MSYSETITRTDLTNILNEVLPNVGGSIQCHNGETVYAVDNGTYWSLQLNYAGLIDETTLPLSILFDSVYWINTFYYWADEFVIPYDVGSNIFEDGGEYTADIYYINV